MNWPQRMNLSTIICCTRLARICCGAWDGRTKRQKTTNGLWRSQLTKASGAFSSADCAKCSPLPPDLTQMPLRPFRAGAQVMLLQIGAHALESLIHAIGKCEQIVFLLRDGPGANHFVPVQYLVPIFPAINQNQVMRGELSRL